MSDAFECETSKLLEKFEAYVTEKNLNITAITSFYQKDFDSNRLSLHRQMFLDQITLKDVEPCWKDLIGFDKKNIKYF